jgi:succinate dehydrogenase / fumarate reductase cytochrome b subunit
MNRAQGFWSSSAGKKAVMAVTGVILVAYLLTHVLANLLVFEGPDRINRYAAILHSTGGALWAARIVLLVAAVLHIIAAVQLAARRQRARPVAYAGGRRPQVSTLASRTIRWGGALLLAFLVFHILHFTTGDAHPQFVELDPYHNVTTGFGNPLVTLFYLLAMAALGFHLYHGIWSSGRSLGVSPPSPQPLHRRVALVLAVLVWLGFTVIVVAAWLGMIRAG